MTLGTALAKTLRKHENDRIRARLAKEEAARLTFERDDRQVRVWLNKAKQEITETITTGKVPKNRRFSDGGGFNASGWYSKPKIDDPLHPHHQAFETFMTWLKENDLEYEILSCHDGMGVYSWYELSITPREGV